MQIANETARNTTPDIRDTTNWEVLGLARFALACIVVCTHAETPGMFAQNISALGGKAAVVAFLLISGYSIAASLAKRPEQFIYRRLLRIYPMYFGAILLTLAAQFFVGPSVYNGSAVTPSGAYQVACNFALAQMYLCKAMSFNGPLWSLGVEFSFYLLAPLFILLPRPLMILAVIVSGIAYSLPAGYDGGIAYTLLTKFNGLKFLWAFVIGFAVFHRRDTATLVAALVLCLALFPMNGSMYGGSLNLITIGVTIMLLGYSHTVSLGRFGKAASVLGDVSYPLYLVHFPLGIILANSFAPDPDALYFAGSVLLACVFLFVFDRAFKQRVFVPLARTVARIGIAKKGDPIAR